MQESRRKQIPIQEYNLFCRGGVNLIQRNDENKVPLEKAKDLLRKYPSLIEVTPIGTPHYETIRNISEAYSRTAHEEPNDVVFKEYHSILTSLGDTRHPPNEDFYPDQFSFVQERTNIVRTHTEDEEEMEEQWTVLSYTDEAPTSFAGWFEGLPHIKEIRRNRREEAYTFIKKITLKSHNDRPIKGRIKRLMGDSGEDIILFDEKIYTKPEFVKMMVYPSSVNAFTECINALPVSKEKLFEPKLYIQDEHIKFPDHYYAKRSDAYQQILVNSLNIGDVDEKTYSEWQELLKKYPKQLTLRYAIIGANIINVLGINDYPITIEAIGESDTGKSFTCVTTLQLDYGIGSAVLQDDAMNSAFRHHALASSTNLPVYVEEAKIQDKTKLKSLGKNLRGKADLTLEPYEVNMTLILSLNTDAPAELDPTEDKALKKRILTYRFKKEDVVPEEEKLAGKNFLKRAKGLQGGMLYEMLKGKSCEEINEKHAELSSTIKDQRLVVAKLGAWIMGDNEFEPALSEEEASDVQDAFLSKILSSYSRIQAMLDDDLGMKKSTHEDKGLSSELLVDSSAMTFKITVNGYNMIKRNIGTNLSARKFAESYGYMYKTVYIAGVRSSGIEGNISPKYASKSDLNV